MQNLRLITSRDFKPLFLESIADVDARQWNALTDDPSPFLRHEFLLALENSGSTTARTGWEPCHLVLENTAGELIAGMPLFRKSHSYGEYVFDWSWAEAWHSHGIAYYPKLLTAIPFTPSPASRLLIRQDAVGDADIVQTIVEVVTGFARDAGLGTWHVLFPTPEQSDALQRHGLLRREATQFHWFNRGYESFDDFLQTFTSRKRKNLRKEREGVLAQGVTFLHFSGAEITENLWDTFYVFYQSTYHVRGQRGYLTRRFFSEIGRKMPESLLLVMAKVGDKYIAGALSFRDSEKLYGRYWGALADFQFLHFETCYYQGIEYCIANGLKSFDSGAQGEHKIQRGFEPIKTYSNHWIADERFRTAIADFTEKERAHIEAYMADAAQFLPFKRDDGA